jgi:hypothetical protein
MIAPVGGAALIRGRRVATILVPIDSPITASALITALI